jgi:hypothetical protein
MSTAGQHIAETAFPLGISGGSSGSSALAPEWQGQAGRQAQMYLQHDVSDRPVARTTFATSTARNLGDVARTAVASWIVYLYAASAPNGPVHPAAVNRARSLWRQFSAAPPAACPTDEGGLFMSWDNGRHHLEVEVSAASRFEWFYLDRETDSRESGEAVFPALPATLREYLRRLRSP